MINDEEQFFLAIPLGILRRFVEENKKEADTYLQLFELIPQHIYSKSELEQAGATFKPKSTIITDGKYFPPHRKEQDVN